MQVRDLLQYINRKTDYNESGISTQNYFSYFAVDCDRFHRVFLTLRFPHSKLCVPFNVNLIAFGF